MNKDLLGSYDFYENPESDLSVTLMCDYKNNLLAFANRLSKLSELRAQDELLYLDFGGEGFMFQEFNENLLAKDGYLINFETATTFFPYLSDETFWIDEKWNGYDGVSFSSLMD